MSSVNDIYATQQQLSSAIETIYTNFKKDGSDRKTQDYIRRRLDTLDNYWFEYDKNYRQLSQSELDGASQDKINQEFERVRERFDTIKAHIQSYQPPTEDRPRTPILKPPTFVSKQGESSGMHTTVKASASKTEEMLKKQHSNFKAFQRTASKINITSISEKWEFEDLLRTLHSRWAVIDALHWELDSDLDGSNKNYEETFSTYEKEYENIKKAINKKMWSVAHQEKSTPQMEVPSFSGNYNSWISFKDLFTETIHNNPSMSDAQKMQYLKAKVKGEAERLIQHLHVSSDNYKACWDILNQRFNNKKLIFTSHINIIMSIPTNQHQTAAHLKRIHDTTLECLNAVKNLGVDVSSWDPLLVHILTQKLDTESYTDYIESVKDPRELPILTEFLNFLETKFTILESARRKPENSVHKNHSPIANQGSKYQSYNHKINQSSFKHSFSTSSKLIPQPTYNKKVISAKFARCALCNTNEHGIYFCPNFLEMAPHKRLQTINNLNLCPICLHYHYGKPCLSEGVCRDCQNKDHNSLLHTAFLPSPRSAGIHRPGAGSSNATRGGSANTSANAGIVSENPQVTHTMVNESVQVLLPTAMIKIQAADGTQRVMRALLDQGSQTSLITEHAAQLLKLPRLRCKGIISGIGDKQSNCKGMMTVKCSSLVNDFTFETDTLIMNQLIKNLPSQSFSKPDWSYLDHIMLADPEFYHSRPVDILLGADVYSTILMDGICRGNPALPTAQQTQLGWILSGNTKSFQCNVVLQNLDEIHKFWEIEEIADQEKLSSEDKQCMDFYQSTTTRREDGRYEVRLPLKPDYQEKLGNSKSKVMAQFYSLEQKLLKNPEIGDEYKLFMNEYTSLGHMIPANDRNKTLQCYLPHHCVTREQSTTTKLRVVFDASSKTSSGQSLNDVMFRGPNLQRDLQSLIIRWRQYQFAFTADLEKMFRQIWLHEQDQNLQMILWRNYHTELLQEFKLATVTYGTKAAPFLAMMTLKQLAQDERENYTHSLAPSVLEESFYMDDLIHGSYSIEAGKQLQSDMINLLRSGGFHLRKWKSNAPELLIDVQTDQKPQDFDFKQAESTKTLGLGWNTEQDNFTFQPPILSTASKVTKRLLLSDIAKLFDPLGWLAPLTVKLKLLFQDVWKTTVEWNEPVSSDICEKWNKIRAELSLISQYKVPRWLQTKENDCIELHGFCDASTKAYACVVYIVVKKATETSIVLVAGKTKLVPLKKNISLPRLELCGAALLSKLMDKIKNCLSDHKVSVYGWVDSMVVLGWLNGDADRWKPFVANRVKQITALMESSCWRYVKSEENPADCASRGLSPSQLEKHSLWWQGPTWLSTYETKINEEQPYSTTLDLKQTKQVNTIQMSNNNEIIDQLLTNQSSLTKAIRILAWVLRFKSKEAKQAYLTAQELNEARLLIVKNVQHKELSREVSDLINNKSVNNKSKIYSLNPYLDNNNIVRVGGRLRHANICHDTRHPAIIPNNTRLAELIIDQAHESSFHGGARLTTSYIRKKYWLIGGINATKKRLRLCVKCKKHSPSQQHQLMGDLPSSRVNPSRPFYHCGVDYTGHVFIKASKGRGIKTTKGYVAVFVCMFTKAVHLELVSDLTASAFLAALRRMSARRGVPGHLYSDQGTNFIGANNILQQELLAIQQSFDDELMAEVANMGAEWHFNAPSWPSAGGLWEAAVKSLKHHLKRVVGEQKLTFEEFTTILSQLEGCLNSRPLCSLTENVEDLEILTPSHFLASGPSLTLYDTETDMRTRWHLTEKIFKDIWTRWHSEYLTQLNERSKWQRPEKNLQINDVVIIKDDNLPAGKWALGRVVQVHPGADGYTRVVTLKTKNGFLKRPVVKLSILPVNKNEQDKTENKQKIPTRTTAKRSYFTTIALSLMLFLFIIPPINCTYKISSLPSNNSLYFDRVTNINLIRDDWRLIVYYDTKPYQEGNAALTKYISYLEELCAKMPEKSYCSGITSQLRHQVDELDHYNNVLMSHHDINQPGGHRHRRGLINGIGSIANDLFGVLDQRFAEKYQQDINLIRENQKHLAILWKNQTSVVEAEFNMLKRTENIVNQHHKLINKKFNSIEKVVNQVKDEITHSSLFNEFISTAFMANNILSNLKDIQQTLLDTVTNIYNGKFNFHLLPPDQLRHELSVITSQLPKDLSIPIDNFGDLSEIYNLLKVRASTSKNYIIFEIKIPLVSGDLYEVLRLIPVPRLLNDMKQIVVVPIADYVAINLNKDAFITLTQEDLKSCMQRNLERMLCHIKKPIFNIKDDQSFCIRSHDSRQCKTITSPCYNKWEELNKINSYLYFCCGQCQVKLLCDDQISAVHMTHSGFFNVDRGCIMKSADFFMYSHRQDESKISISSNIVAPEISPINHFVNISIPEILLPSNNNQSENDNQDQIREIEKNLKTMKESQGLSYGISYHDVHHYTVIYIMMCVVGVVIVVWIWRRCKARATPAAAARAQPLPARRDTQPLPSRRDTQQCAQGSEQCEVASASARVSKQDRSSSPVVLRSVFSISD